MTVYRPAGISLGSCERRAFSLAVRAIATGSIVPLATAEPFAQPELFPAMAVMGKFAMGSGCQAAIPCELKSAPTIWPVEYNPAAVWPGPSPLRQALAQGGAPSIGL